MNRAPRVLALCGDETGCSLWRIWQPFAELEKRGFIAEWCHKDASDRVLPLVAAGRYDLVVTPRIVWPAEGLGDTWLNAIHKAGLAWVYEVDDDVYSPRIVDRQIRLFASEAKKGAVQLEWERNERIRLLERCDGVTVTTQRLATVIRGYVPDKNVYVIPNAIDAKWFRETLRGCGRVPELKDRLTIGWAGGTREDLDILPMVEAWATLAKRFPHVMFVNQGHLSQIMVDAIPKDQLVTLPWLPLPEYPRGLINIDIGCCIVAPTIFNTSKSCIKWYEMTLAGAACVVSKTVYGREVTDGEDALVAESTEDWIRSLTHLIEDEDYRRQLQRAARKTVMTEHSLENNWWRWPTAWADVIDRFTASHPRLVLATA